MPMGSTLLLPKAPQEMKIAFGQFTAQTAITNRDKLAAEIEHRIKEVMKGSPIIIDSTQLQDVQFSPAYIQSIENRMQMEVESSTKHQEALREIEQAKITVTKAGAEADSNLAIATAKAKATQVNAEADARATILRGDAEAQAIKAKGDALRENPQLVELTKAESWDGKLPTTMIPGTALPFLDVSPN